MTIYHITPVAKPRMTRRDKFQPPRPIVAQFFAFRDQCRWLKVKLPEGGAHVTFIIPMPASWSKKKRAEMGGKRHQQTPDLDNLVKALADSCFLDDKRLWDVHATKVWGSEGRIVIN